jgi:hypothetical protein
MTTDAIIGGAALALTLYGMAATRKHNRLSVKPSVVSRNHTNWADEGMVYSYDLCNFGIGPAVIRKFTLILDGKPFCPDTGSPVAGLIKTVFSGEFNFVVRNNSFPNAGYILPANQTYQVVEIFFSKLTAGQESKFDQLKARMNLCVEYESLYGDWFVFDTREKAH